MPNEHMRKDNGKKKQKKSFLFHLGNLLILLSLFGFIVTFLPLVITYFSPPPLVSFEKIHGYVITIPKIKAQAPVIDNVDPWHEVAYKAALHHGVAHAKGTAEPGQPGLGFYFAHSSGLPWELTRYNTVFLRLGELQNGDQIFINKDGKRYVYTVYEKKEVWPNDINALLSHEHRDEIVLQTCVPIGTSLKRLLIFASHSVQ